jgi:diguanylate cyclase
VPYGRQAQEFDQAIAALDVEQPLHQLAEAVFETIHDLRQANCDLQRELEECQCKLAEETQRAIAAETDARIDVLTQLLNRRSFDERLAELQSLQERRAQPYALILIDIDHFKRINDNYGHAAGDAILAMLGRVLTDCRRATDHVSRFGGDEFALLAVQCSEDQAKVIAERYRKRIALASLRYGSERLQVTVSVGVARVDSESTSENVLERADHALYLAKESGCNCCRVFDDTQQMPLATIG